MKSDIMCCEYYTQTCLIQLR